MSSARLHAAAAAPPLPLPPLTAAAAAASCAAAATPARTPNSNFLRGVKWSPDGACLLTASDDNW